MMTFISETRKKKIAAVERRWGERRKKMLRLAPIKAGRGWQQRFFAYAWQQRRQRVVCAHVCTSASVNVRVHVVTGLIRQCFPGTREDVGEGPGGS